MTKELFLEIGTEEIPAAFLPKAMTDLEGLIRKEFEAARLSFGEVRTLATPRRLALLVTEVADCQPDAEVTALGPARKVAFDADGKPTKAAEGFARGQGVDVADLVVAATEKGEYVSVTKKIVGCPSEEILVEILPRVIGAIPFRKSMRWADLDVRFARPMHWIVALFDGAVVPFSFGPIKSGSASRGHRFMANSVFPVRDFAHYLEECERHFVIPEPEKRKEIIRREVEQAARAMGGQVLPDEDLLEQVAYLVEYPSVVCGTFEKDFLQVPKEVLITSMREHQRYFSLVDDKGQLLPHFITVNNTLAEDPAVVTRGNERVLRARLSDARFFFEEDKKTPLAERVDSLKEVVYQAKLGTSFEKMERFRTIAEKLSSQLAPELSASVSRAAYLCKADLVTGMVGEFPELQGIMGREYALLAGEDQAVARAIHEHYLPVQAGGALPTSDVGALVSIADKIDTICGCFGVGLIPTGTADPYALRRSALGIIAIILDRGYELLLSELVDASLQLLQKKLTRDYDTVRAEVLEFFRGRYVNMLAGRYPADVVDAAVAVSFDNLNDTAARIAALAEFKERPDFEPLAVAFKRVCNIVKQGVDIPVDAALFEGEAERELAAAFEVVAASAGTLIAAKNYLAALTEIAGLRGAVDTFFDQVMVMAEDEKVKNNRLALLTGIARLFGGIADIARISA
ncbi:MAG: glycine--tRNA ligase subunit beta [Deltaproteobacteria bacterium]|nr:glycine--tRNA ligase subunit beta [Deltaproteobacteria bacterium]TLN00661.1 MAG: glycine--tRNA ligase subunit beta [bacterium]